jgi:hypothetical protein
MVYVHFVSCYTRDPPLWANSTAEVYKSSTEPHFLHFRHLNSYQLYPHILKPNYILNTALFMQLSASGTDMARSHANKRREKQVRLPDSTHSISSFDDLVVLRRQYYHDRFVMSAGH